MANKRVEGGGGRKSGVVKSSKKTSSSNRAFYLLIAGIMHLPKRGKNAQEQLATWTDLIVGVAVVVLGVYVLVRALAG